MQGDRGAGEGGYSPFNLSSAKKNAPKPFWTQESEAFLTPSEKGEGKGGIWDVNKGYLAVVEPGSCKARADKPKILYLLKYHWRSKGVTDGVKIIVFFRKKKQNKQKKLLCLLKAGNRMFSAGILDKSG